MTRQNPPRDERFQLRRLAEIERRLHSLETAPTWPVWPGQWTNITLAAGYSAAKTGAYGNGYIPAYRFLGPGRVEIRGTVQAGTGAGGAGANGFDNADVMATLPAEIRPAETVHTAIVGATGGAAASYGVYRVIITAAGALQFHSGIAAAPGWIALDGIFYDLT